MGKELNLLPKVWRVRNTRFHKEIEEARAIIEDFYGSLENGYLKLRKLGSRLLRKVDHYANAPVFKRWRNGGAADSVGIRLDSDAIHLCHISRESGEPVIKQIFEIALPVGVIDDFFVTDASVLKDKLRWAFDILVKNGMPPSAKAALSIDGHSVLVKNITVPEMTDEELEAQIPYEAEQHIPFDINDVVVAWEINRKLGDGTMRVYLTAVKADYLYELLSLVRGVGFKLSAVEPVAWSLRSLLEKDISLAELTKDGAICFFNFGNETCNIVIFDANGLAFTRTIILQTSVDEAMENFMKATDFYLATHAKRRIVKIVYSGKVDHFEPEPFSSIAKALEKQYGEYCQVVALSPVTSKSLEVNSEETRRLAVVIGLALRTDWRSIARAPKFVKTKQNGHEHHGAPTLQ